MKFAQCALCATRMSDVNDSREHIIPQAIGGRRSVRGFICQTCNKEKGNKWERALADQFKDISLFLNIKRQKPLPNVVVNTADGQQLLLTPDGSTATLSTPLHPKVTEDTVQLQSVPHHLVKGQIRGIKKKYRVEEIRVEEGVDYHNHVYALKWNIGGADTCRSIMKTAVALAVEGRIAPSDCNVARRLLADSTVPCSSSLGYFYSNEHDVIEERPVPVLHCVAINGDPTTEKLIGYVEYFGAFRMVAVLSDCYRGTAFAKNYAIDPISGMDIELNVNLGFVQQQIQDILDDKYYDKRVRYSAVSTLAHIAIDRRLKKEDEFVAKAIVQMAAAARLQGADLDSLDRFTEEVMDKCKLFLRHNHERFRGRRDHYRQFMNHLVLATIGRLGAMPNDRARDNRRIVVDASLDGRLIGD